MNIVTLGLLAALVAGTLDVEMAVITGGEYRPLYYSENSEQISVSSFILDITPVSNIQFFEFIGHTPVWKKNSIPTLFTEDTYLGHWSQHDNVWQPEP